MTMILAAPRIYALRPKLAFKNIGSGGGNGSNSGLDLNGNGSISGIVTENGVPVSRSVMLYERSTGAFSRKGRSSADGSYTFSNTNEKLTYFVIAIDDNKDENKFNLVGQDLIAGDHDQRTKP